MLATLITATVVLLLMYFSILYVYLLKLVRHDDDIPVASLQDMQNDLGTGDIILFRHKKYNTPLSSGNRIMSHMAVLWNHPTEGLCIVDMNPDPNGPYGDTLPFREVLRGRRTLVYRLQDSLRTYPGEVFVRRLKRRATQEQELCFGTLLTQWALDLEYVDGIASRSLLPYAAFFFGIMTQPIASGFASMSDLAEPRTASFCSEMIGQLMTRCGIVNLEDVPLHFSGPINWRHDLGEHSSQYSWGTEIQLTSTI